MPAFLPIAGNSIYSSRLSFFLPVRRRISSGLAHVLRTADAVCQRVVGHREDFSPSGKFANDQAVVRRYEDLFWDFSRAAVVCLGGSLGKDREIRLIAGVISFIVGVASSYLIGKHWGDRFDAAGEEARVFYERTIQLPTYRQYDSNNQDMVRIRKILFLEEDLFKKIKRYATYHLAVRMGIFVASLFGMGGAISATYSALTIAAGLGAVSTAAWLIAEGTSFAVGEQKRVAQRLYERLGQLRYRTSF